MNTVTASIAGRQYTFAYTVGALLELQEKFGDSTAVIDAVSGADSSAVTSICRIAAVLAEQGELVRRYMGYEPAPFLRESDIMFSPDVAETAALQRLIPAALYRGLRREIKPEEEEIDLGLAELNAEKSSDMALAHFLRMGAVGGLTKKEVLLSFPGELADLWELHLQACGVRKKRGAEEE